MPIDSAIPLQVRPQQPINPLADVAQIMQLRQAQALLPLKIQEAQQNLQESQLKTQAAQREAQEQLDIKQAIADAGGDIEKALPKIRQVAPKTGLAFEKALRDQQESEFKARGEQLKNAITSTDLGARLLQGVPDAADPAHAYQAARKAMGALGLDVNAMSPEYDPEEVKQHISSGLSTKEKLQRADEELKNEIARRKEARDQAEFVTKQPGLEADTAMKVAEAQGQKPIQPVDRARLEFEARKAAQTQSNFDRNLQETTRSHRVREGIALQGLQNSGGAPLTDQQKSIAQKLATGDFNPAQLSRFKDKEALISGALEINPNWSSQTYATKRSFEDPQSKQAQNLGTISRIVGHIARFEKNSNELGVSPSLLTGTTLSGTASATRQDAHAISSELEKLLSGGVGTIGQVKEWQNALTSSIPSFRQAAIDEISKLIGSQYEGMNQTYRTTIGTDLPIDKYISPAGRQWMKAKGINVGDAASSGGGGQADGGIKAVTTKAERDALPKGAQYTKPGDPTVYIKQ